MQQFLENPTIGREAKKAVVVNMLSKQKYSDLVVNFFKAMADYGRLNDSLKAIAAFEKIMKEYNSEIQVRVISNQVLLFTYLCKILKVSRLYRKIFSIK